MAELKPPRIESRPNNDTTTSRKRHWVLTAWLMFTLIAFSLVLHVIGYAAQQPRISIVALFTGIYGIMGLAWGWDWLRASFFPFFLFAFCVPLGTLAEVKPISGPLVLTRYNMYPAAAITGNIGTETTKYRA